MPEALCRCLDGEGFGMVRDERVPAKRVAVFNEAINQLYRTHLKWLRCDDYRTHGKYVAWQWELDSVEVELKPDAMMRYHCTAEQLLNEEEIRDNPYITSCFILNQSIEEAMRVQDKAKLYRALKKKEEYLRTVYHELGKSAKYVDVDDGGMI